MSTVILCHTESVNLDALRASDANIVRYSVGVKLQELKAARIRNLGLHIQNRDAKIRILEDMEITKGSLEDAGSFVSQFFRWLIAEVLIEGAFIDFLLTTPVENTSQICLALQGAFGSAVLYRRREDSSLVIIKEINMYDLDSSQRRLALNEVSLLSRIEHPNIIAYYDSFEEEGVLMIEMEYADGGTLAQLLSRSQSLLDEDQIVDTMIQMCSAVAYLHENSVLHRSCTDTEPVLFRAVLFRAVLFRAVLFRAVLFRTVLFRTVLFRTVLFRTVLFRTVLFRTVLFWAVLFWAVLFWAVLFWAVLFWAVLFRTVLFRTVLFRAVLFRPVLFRAVLFRAVL
uniref:Protein kinase domain-containing protein n=1 Tax=Caenorhabditis japonica TaxID=281687 RepID=A0A8R1DR89_CAEJA